MFRNARWNKAEQSASLMPAIKKSFVLMGYDIIELSRKSEYLKNKKIHMIENGQNNLKQSF